MTDLFENFSDEIEENAGAYAALGGLAGLKGQEAQRKALEAQRKALEAQRKNLASIEGELKKASGIAQKEVMLKRKLVILEERLDLVSDSKDLKQLRQCLGSCNSFRVLIGKPSNELSNLEDIKFARSLEKKADDLDRVFSKLCARKEFESGMRALEVAINDVEEALAKPELYLNTTQELVSLCSKLNLEIAEPDEITLIKEFKIKAKKLDDIKEFKLRLELLENSVINASKDGKGLRYYVTHPQSLMDLYQILNLQVANSKELELAKSLEQKVVLLDEERNKFKYIIETATNLGEEHLKSQKIDQLVKNGYESIIGQFNESLYGDLHTLCSDQGVMIEDNELLLVTKLVKDEILKENYVYNPNTYKKSLLTKQFTGQLQDIAYDSHLPIRLKMQKGLYKLVFIHKKFRREAFQSYLFNTPKFKEEYKILKTGFKSKKGFERYITNSECFCRCFSSSQLNSFFNKNSTGHCFVATAVYGDHNHPQVQKLRNFRDAKLNKSIAGRHFIKFYYAIGPTLALLPRSSKLTKRLLRHILDRF